MSAIDLGDPRVSAVFFELFEGLVRGGPGSAASTLRALALVGELPPRPLVLDLGCGPGRETLVLAEALADARILAVDLHLPFLTGLARRLAEHRVDHHTHSVQADMAALPLADASCQLIWCEGAAYSVGVENALRHWRPLLAPGAAVALSEATWFRPDPPEELRTWWAEEYPELEDLSGCVERFERAGYLVTGHFQLPEEDWWQELYTPMETRIAELRNRYGDDPAAAAVLAVAGGEIEMFRRYSGWFGYTFFVTRRRD